MKIIPFVAAVVIAIAIVRLPAQDTDADAQAKGYANAAPSAGGFGDVAASRSWEMTSVTGELQNKLDTESAKVGDRVTLKTTDKVQSSNGTVIRRGSRLVGHITELQAHNSDRAIAQIGIVFDHAELKNGENVPIHTLIRGLRPRTNLTAVSPMPSDDSMSSTMGGGRMSGGGTGGRGGVLGGAGGLGASGTAPDQAGSPGGSVAGTADRSGGTATGTGVGTGGGAGLPSDVNAREDAAVQLAGHGDTGAEGGAHAAAAARTVPRPTGIPGIMLAGSNTASGLFLNADRKDIQLESGTRFELGVVADR
jgi:hypothetical protein